MFKDIHKERGNRLAFARKKAGFKYAIDFSKTVNIHEATYRTYESGARTLSYEKSALLGSALGVSGEWIYSGKIQSTMLPSVPIVGRMKGGNITASHPLTGSLTVNNKILSKLPVAEVPPEMDAALLFAVEIEDNYFAPFVSAGSKIYYNRTPDKTDECIGALCIIQIKNGKAICDIITRGSHPGLYDTQYHGRDIEIEWCAKRRFTKDA